MPLVEPVTMAAWPLSEAKGSDGMGLSPIMLRCGVDLRPACVLSQPNIDIRPKNQKCIFPGETGVSRRAAAFGATGQSGRPS